MASTLPHVATDCCPSTCEDPAVVNIPGPIGSDGADGANGTNGVNAYTTFTADFAVPAELGSAVASVADSSWIAVNQILYATKADGSVSGYFRATAIPSALSVTLQNLEDLATFAYLINSPPDAVITSGSKLSPAGIQGPSVNPSGDAGGHLKGTYPNPTLLLGNTKGSIIAGNGTDSVAVPAGTNGHMLAYDSTDAEGIKSFAALPLTGGTDVLDNRVARLDGTTGLPIPMQSSKLTITDDGAIRADGSNFGVLGDTRGTRAVDLSVNRGASTQVASGEDSVLCGGLSNTVSGIRAACVGGDTNIVAATEGFIGGGESNWCHTGNRATICGGQNNEASGSEAFVGAGQDNTASGAQSVIGGGDGNIASGQEAVVGGGDTNNASGQSSFIGGGQSNVAVGDYGVIAGGQAHNSTGNYSTVGGGFNNAASAIYSTVPGGNGALADNYGQMARASGLFAADGDAQVMELIWRRETTDATPSELFLDGASIQAVVPAGASWIFDIILVARRSTGTTSIYTSIGQISNVAGTVAVAAVTTTEVNDGIGLPVTPVAVTANDPTNALVITCTGVAANTIRWVAHARIVQVIHGT